MPRPERHAISANQAYDGLYCGVLVDSATTCCQRFLHDESHRRRFDGEAVAEVRLREGLDEALKACLECIQVEKVQRLGPLPGVDVLQHRTQGTSRQKVVTQRVHRIAGLLQHCRK